jgi:DnaA family protein
LRDIGSRFGAATVHRIHELDERAQAEALGRRASLRGLELPDETTRYLQRRFRRDMRTLCSLLDTLDEASLAEQRRITVPFIREVLGDSAGSQP